VLLLTKFRKKVYFIFSSLTEISHVRMAAAAGGRPVRYAGRLHRI